MKRILESFKNLYKGQDIVKTHLLIAALFILPALFGATVQFLDKDYKEYLIPILIASVVLACLTIIPILFLSGYYIKFVNKRLHEPEGIPVLNSDCIIQGIKLIPVYLVWTLYIGIPLLLIFGIILFGAAAIFSGKPEISAVILTVLAIIGLTFLVFIALFILSPFIQQVYIRYAQDFEYCPDVFNPLTPFRYMKKAFKETMIVALKFLVVSIAVNALSQIIMIIFVIFAVLIGIIATIFSSDTSDSLPPAAIFILIFVSAISGVIQGYATQMTALAYVDNLEDVYKEKIIEKSDNEKESE